MVIKKSKEFSRFEWTKNISTSIGNIDSWSMAGKLHTKKDVDDYINRIFNRLVTCTEYGKVYGAMRGEPSYSGTRIHNMADNKFPNRERNRDVKQGLNKFVINGIMFILMTQAEYDVYIKMTSSRIIAHSHSMFRKYLMSHPKTKEANHRVEVEREEAVLRWKSGAEPGKIGVDMAYHGAEWDYFFTEVFPTWENKVAADTVAMWSASAGYYANSSATAVKKVRMPVAEMWKEYRKWCVGQRYIPLYVKQFSIRMKEMNFMRRTGSGVRAFDVFVGAGADMTEWEQKRKEREAAERERMRAMRAERMEVKHYSEFLSEIGGRYRAASLWAMYEDWCRKNGQQLGFGKRNFYKFLDEAGFKRETVGGTLWMEKK